MPPSVALRRLGPRMPDSLSRQPQRCRHTSTPRNLPAHRIGPSSLPVQTLKHLLVTQPQAEVAAATGYDAGVRHDHMGEVTPPSGLTRQSGLVVKIKVRPAGLT